jgi:hypothetical protein
MTTPMLDIDLAWVSFCDGEYAAEVVNAQQTQKETKDAPKSSDIYISTQTKISFLNQKISLQDVFWKIPVIAYHLPQEGVVKKQMKFSAVSQEELDGVRSNLPEDSYVDEFIITQIINPEGRIKFKDVRKISIGLCKKDITSYRCKKKSAFYNCFVVILRLLDGGKYKEIHVKVFNTGKLEIPGIQTTAMLQKVLRLLTAQLAPLVESDKPLEYIQGASETVLINSNFSCGYYINREKLYDALKYTYNINSAYDPCSYPGIQCEFYYDPKLTVQTGKQPPSGEDSADIVKVSFMIFRTGSVLIVGKCTEPILEEIYHFLTKLLEYEYRRVGGKHIDFALVAASKKKRKIRKKTIIIQV